MKRIGVIFSILAMALPLLSQVYIPPYDMVNRDLRYLQVTGQLNEIDLQQGPVLSNALLTTLRNDLSRPALSATQKNLMERMRLAYQYSDTAETRDVLNRLIQKFLVNQVQQPHFYLGGRLDLEADSDPGTVYPTLRTFAAAVLPYGISVVNVMAVDPYATENPGYIGHQWRHLTGYTEQAYLLWQTKFSRVILGRAFLVNGPGRQAQLLFSGAARPMDQVRLEFYQKYFSFQSVAAQLDPIDGADRYLNSHRLSIHLGGWQFALSELILYGGVGQRLEFAFLNPFIFYHGEQMNGPSLAGNTLGTLEMRYTGKHWSAYTELLIDDIQLDHEVLGDLEPNELGLVAGIDLADPLKIDGLYLGLEYAAVSNRTYKTATRYEWYTHRNMPIGYALGSDLDCWDLEIRKYLNHWQATFNINYLRQGEGELSQAWDTPWLDSMVTMASGYDEPFPTGVVEKTLDLGLELRWQPSYPYYAYLRLNYRTVQNVDHGANNRNNLILTLGLHWDFRYKF